MSLKGKLLISNNLVTQDYFAKLVILILTNTKNYSTGIVINKVLKKKSNLVQIFPSGDIYEGGPVDKKVSFIVHNQPKFSSISKKITRKLFYTKDLNILKQDITQFKYKIYLGYSFWIENQLEQEIENNYWIILKPKIPSSYIFSKNKNKDIIWRKSLKEKGGLYQYFANYVKSPILN